MSTADRFADAACIEIVNISKSFGATEVLKGLSLTAFRGEFVALLGPSGCGKSTILRIIAGIEACDEGEIVIEGQVANYLRPSARNVYPVHPRSRKSLGEIIRKLSVTESQNSAHLLGTSSRRNSRVVSANSPQVP